MTGRRNEDWAAERDELILLGEELADAARMCPPDAVKLDRKLAAWDHLMDARYRAEEPFEDISADRYEREAQACPHGVVDASACVACSPHVETERRPFMRSRRSQAAVDGWARRRA